MDAKQTVHLVFLIITTAPIIGGLVYVWQKYGTLSTEQPRPQTISEQTESAATPTPKKEEEQVKSIIYTNDVYGFSFTFPETWKGFIATNRTLEWEFGNIPSIDFGFPVQDSLFNVSIFTKDQWQKLQSEEGIKPTKISENDTHVFAYERAQYAENNAMIERMKEVSAITQSFTVN